MPLISGLSEAAQIIILTVVSPLFANTIVPFTDELGTPLTVTLTADYPDAQFSASLTAPLIHVGMQLGAVWTPTNQGYMGPTEDGTLLQFLMGARDCRAVFTVYAQTDPQRRYLADALIWGIQTAYVLDSGGNAVTAAIFTQLIASGLYPRPDPLFDAVDYPPVNLSEPRPEGLPYRAIVRMHFDLQLPWSFSPTNPGVAIVLGPSPPLPLVQPVTISLPFTLATG